LLVCNSAYAVDCPTAEEKLATYPEWYFWLFLGFPLFIGLITLSLAYARNRKAILGVLFLIAFQVVPMTFAYLRYLGIA
jgi:hypothetical protein